METDVILEVARRGGRTLVRKGAPRGEVLIQCPTPANHRNADAHPSCRLNGEKNTWYCDVCGGGGGVKDLAEALGVDHSAAGGGTSPMNAAGRGETGSLKAKLPLVFDSRGLVSAETMTFFADTLGKKYTHETWAAFGALEGSVYPKGKLERSEPAVAFTLPQGGAHVYRYTRADRAPRWCFANGGRSGLLAIGFDRPDPVLLCEGEWDAMRAHDEGFAVATGTGGAGTWKKAWNESFANRSVAVVYDVDKPGETGAARPAIELRGAAASVRVVTLPLSGDPEKDGKDLSDFLAVHPVEELHKLIGEAGSSDAGLAGLSFGESQVAAAIDATLNQEIAVRLKRREAAALVVADLKKYGELVHADGGRLFWFEKGDARLFDLDAFPFRCLFLKRYQINPAEREFTHVFEAVRSVARSDGRRVHVCRFAFYDIATSRLYVRGGPDLILRLDGSAITRVDNGTDDVLFEESSEVRTIPAEAIDRAIVGDPLHEHILGRVNFTRGVGVVLSDAQQRLILRVWVLAAFFPELLPARSLLLMYGEKGSGKTTTLRTILKLLVGPQANVTPLGKEDGFNAAVSTEYLLVFDNVDSYCRWIEDRLATVSTGQTIRLRKLYTTNEMLSFPTRCCIALTARTPRFRRDDVVDRLQVLRVSRLERFGKETEWYEEIERFRADLWAQILHDLNATVARLRSASVEVSETIRMADWAFVATTIGEALGLGPEIRDALEASELDKAHFLLEADEIYDLLYAIAHERPNHIWKAGELFGEIKHRADAAEIELHVKSSRSLGRILHRLAPALERMIRFNITTNTHDGQAEYVLGPLPPATPSTSADEPHSR